MNRTDRLLAIILELQDRKQLRAQDLAAIFEVSKRIVYRDIQALSEAGVPLISVTGQGYALMEGFFLPPVSFNADEAFMLVLGSQVMAQYFDAQYRLAAQSARRKIEAVLPTELRRQVESLQDQINFFAAGNANSSLNHDYVRLLRQAIIERRTVRLTYRRRFSQTDESPQSVREVDPYSLIYRATAWYLFGYCHLRQETRHFRLDRIEDLQPLNKTFTADAFPSASSASPRNLVCAFVSTGKPRPGFENPTRFTLSMKKQPPTA
jgi:predicted DNA-binding transcriptional regulator YafY